MQAQFDATSNVVTDMVRKLCTEADQPCVLVPVLVPVLLLLLLLLPLLLLVCVCCSRLPPSPLRLRKRSFSLCWEVPQRLTRRASGGA